MGATYNWREYYPFDYLHLVYFPTATSTFSKRSNSHCKNPEIMLTSSVFRNSITSISIISSTKTKPKSSKSNSLNNFSFQFRIRANLQQQQQPLLHQSSNTAEFDEREKSKPRVLLNSIRVLEWDKVCDAVSSFAGTSLGRLASKVCSIFSQIKFCLSLIFRVFDWIILYLVKEQLCSFDQTYEESLMLLRQTNAAVEIHKYNNAIMDFTGLDVFLVCTFF